MDGYPARVIIAGVATVLVGFVVSISVQFVQTLNHTSGETREDGAG